MDWENWGFIGHRVTEWQTPKVTQYTGGWNFLCLIKKTPLFASLAGGKWNDFLGIVAWWLIWLVVEQMKFGMEFYIHYK